MGGKETNLPGKFPIGRTPLFACRVFGGMPSPIVFQIQTGKKRVLPPILTDNLCWFVKPWQFFVWSVWMVPAYRFHKGRGWT